MSRNGELDSLKAKEQEAFRQKQAAYQRYEEAKKLTNSAYINMQSAWNDRCSAREVMNSEYEAMQASNSNYREVWAEYSRIRDDNNARIQRLRSDSDHEHRMMQDCFGRASFAYTSGDKAEASSLSAEGRSHKERRDSINAEVSSLSYEIRSAKMGAESRAPKTDGSAFRSAKSAFNEAKSCHESAQAEFNRLKAERDRLKAEFDAAQKRFLQYKEEFQKKLAEVKAKNQQERDRILDKAGITGAERADAKIVKKADGTIQVYHGGFGPGDGFGHGHTAIDQSGVITYDRDAFESHGAQNYTDHEERKQGGILAYDRDAFESHGAQSHADHQEEKKRVSSRPRVSRNYTENDDGSWNFEWGGKMAKGYPNRKRPDEFTDILYDGSKGNTKDDGHGHIIIENSSGDVVMHWEPGADRSSTNNMTTWDERCPGYPDHLKNN